MLGRKPERAQPSHWLANVSTSISKMSRASPEVSGSLRGRHLWLTAPRQLSIQPPGFPSSDSLSLSTAVFVCDGPAAPAPQWQCLLMVEMVYFLPRRATSFLLAVVFVFHKHPLSSHNPGWLPPAWVAASGFELLILPLPPKNWDHRPFMAHQTITSLIILVLLIILLQPCLMEWIIRTCRFSLQHDLKGEFDFFSPS